MTPYYDADGVTIYHGDNAEVLDGLGLFDLVVTSAPYNKGAAPWAHGGHWKFGQSAGGAAKWRGGEHGKSGVPYAAHDDAMPWAQYVAWQQNCVRSMWDHLAPDGAIFYNHSPRVVGNRLWTPLELIPAEVLVRQIITWDRGSGLNFNPTAFLSVSEWIIVLAREDWRLKSRGVSGLGDVWRIPPVADPDHPASFPLRIPQNAIEACAPTSVLDPFMGVGTTLRAAKDLGVRAVGIEISERYCEIAAKRLGQGVLDFGEVLR